MSIINLISENAADITTVAQTMPDMLAGYQDTLRGIFDPLASPPSPTYPEPPKGGLLQRTGLFDTAKDIFNNKGIKLPNGSIIGADKIPGGGKFTWGMKI